MSPERVHLPKGPGSLDGIGENVQPNLSMGLLGYGLDISLPRGYEGATPSLRISYGSSSGNSELGIGWSLPLPYIERMTRDGLPRYAAEDRFAAQGSDELVRINADGTYRTRFEGAFIRYRWVDASHDGRGGYWTAEYPDGRIGYFGALADGTLVPQARVEGPSGTFRYHLSDVVDRLGHHVVYGYTKHGGYSLLSSVSYVFGATGPRYVVELGYETRGDVLSDAKPGFELRLEKRLSSITVKARARQVRRYALTYDSPSSTAQISRLARVEQYGLDDQGPLPVVLSFSYTGGLGTACAGCRGPEVVEIDRALGLNFKAGSAELIDLNGDTLPDVVDTATAKHVRYMNELRPDGQAFAAGGNSRLGGANLTSAHVQLVDVNGDGFTDLVNGQTSTIYWNHGHGDWEQSESPAGFAFPDLATDLNARFFDFDNDKRIDLLHADESSTWVYANRGNGRFQQVLDVDPIRASFAAGLQLSDMNGDGMPDVVRTGVGLVAYRMNLGWGRFGNWLELQDVPANPPAEQRFVDLNGDGLSDLVSVQADAVKYALNQGGRKLSQLTTLAASSDLPIPITTPDWSVRFADMNGSGSTDVVWIDASGRVTYLELFPERANLLRRVENGLGKVIDIQYGSSAAHMARDGGPGAWKYRVPHPMITLDRVDTHDAHSGVHYVQSFRYRNGYYDRVEHQFRGFEDVEVLTTGDGHTEPGLVAHRFDVGASDPYRKALLLSQRTESNGRVLNEAEHKYEDCPVAQVPAMASPSVRHVCMTELTHTLKEGRPEAEWATLREAYGYDGFGNRTRSERHGVVAFGGGACEPCQRSSDTFGAPCGPLCTGDESFEASDYIAPQKGGWLLNRVSRHRVFGRSNGSAREERFYYDGEAFEGLPEGQLTVGLVSRVDTWSEVGDRGLVHAQRFRYDEHGAVVASLDPNGHRRSFGYDPDSLLPTSETVQLDDAGHEAYELEMSVEYHPVLDTVVASHDWARVTAAGGTTPAVTRFAYDAFGRLERMALPGDTLDAASEEYAYDLASPISSLVKRARSKAGGSFDLEEVQCFDGQGRKYQVRTRLESGSYQVSGYSVYQVLGSEARGYQGYVSNRGACDRGPPSAVLFAESTYDALGRVLSVSMPDGEVYGSASELRTEYAPLRITSWDEEDTDEASEHFDTPKIVWKDGLDRTVALGRELVPGSPHRTQLSYDELGNLRGYVDPKGNEKVQAYDLLGRLVEVADPDAGRISYRYDPAGNLVSETDARRVTLIHAYDEINRPLADWDASSPMTTVVRRQYDELEGCRDCTELPGRLAQVVYPLSAANEHGQDRFGYDARGRAVYLSRTLDGHDFELRNAYDNAGRLSATEYPGNISFSYRYDGAGRLTAAPGYIAHVAYEARGPMRELAFNNGVVSQYEYDARARLTRIVTTAEDESTIQDSEYTRDRAGNILQIEDRALEDSSLSESAEYEYDAWYRLTTARLVPQAKQPELISTSYDELDNILSKTSNIEASREHVGAYKYGERGAGPHALSSAGKVKLDYDASGNLVKRADMALAWDHLGRLASASRGEEELGQYAYGPARDRVRKREGGKTSYYVTPDFEVRDGVAIAYLKVHDQRVVRVEAPTFATSLFPDLAPAELSDGQLTHAPDGQISAADAWLANALATKVFESNDAHDVAEQTVGEMLAASARRLALGNLDASEPKATFLHLNHQGTLIAASGADGALSERNATTPWGSARSAGVPSVDYLYTGKETDSATQLSYFGSRYYLSHEGRWAAADPAFLTFREVPAGDGRDAFGAYAFVDNNPVNLVDPNGDIAFIPVILGAIWVADKAYAAYEAYQDYKAIESGEKSVGEVVGGRALEHGLAMAAGPIGRVAGKVGTKVVKAVAGEAIEKVVKEGTDALGKRLRGTAGRVEDATADVGGGVARGIREGSFSLAHWRGYPSGVAKPTGPFRVLQGAEYDAARKAANEANAALRRADPAKYAGKQIHEIHPVKFGGSPTDPANKVALTPSEHAQYTTFWNQLMRELQ